MSRSAFCRKDVLKKSRRASNARNAKNRLQTNPFVVARLSRWVWGKCFSLALTLSLSISLVLSFFFFRAASLCCCSVCIRPHTHCPVLSRATFFRARTALLMDSSWRNQIKAAGSALLLSESLVHNKSGAETYSIWTDITISLGELVRFVICHTCKDSSG